MIMISNPITAILMVLYTVALVSSSPTPRADPIADSYPGAIKPGIQNLTTTSGTSANIGTCLANTTISSNTTDLQNYGGTYPDYIVEISYPRMTLKWSNSFSLIHADEYKQILDREVDTLAKYSMDAKAQPIQPAGFVIAGNCNKMLVQPVGGVVVADFTFNALDTAMHGLLEWLILRRSMMESILYRADVGIWVQDFDTGMHEDVQIGTLKWEDLSGEGAERVPVSVE